MGSLLSGQQGLDVILQFAVGVGLKDNPAAELLIVKFLPADSTGSIQSPGVEVRDSGEVVALCFFTVLIRDEFEEVNNPPGIAVYIGFDSGDVHVRN
jgi:hypothetical protein